ncbi:TPA: hypothetical protein N0F65_012512 [Lagenidium giganteum]|uniref:Uncharacterized protein n=1 Tax=Lagenidium giganteum TaxID=4803 RepID=A0AAV2YJ33_9STRA|nr:TPA: hypothetical protein N0F65_012512 [Lagenidium giganteum]
MKTALASGMVVLATIGLGAAADVMESHEAPAMDVGVGTHDVLRSPTGLLNKNTLAMDNNVFIARSNVAFSQDDRLALGRKIEAMVTEQKDVDAGTLSRNMLKAVTGKDTDAVLMTKASGVVAASRSADQSMTQQRISDFVNTALAMMKEGDKEAALEQGLPSGVVLVPSGGEPLKRIGAPKARTTEKKADGDGDGDGDDDDDYKKKKKKGKEGWFERKKKPKKTPTL